MTYTQPSVPVPLASVAVWDEENQYWADGNYKLRVVTSGETAFMVVSKIA